MARVEKVRFTEWNKVIRTAIKQLDATNVKILTAMGKYGPRNLLEVSRRTRIPFTSVYHRIAKLETKTKKIATLIPQVSGLGLVRVVVLASARPGREDRLTAALKIPEYWRAVNRCEGTFSHFSVHLIPEAALKDFRQFIKRLETLDLTAKSNVVLTGDFTPNPLNFACYNPASSEWTFPWKHWATELRAKPTATIGDPAGYEVRADEKDMLIVKELEKNGRKSFADLAPLLGISLQGVKYHYDKKLVPSGIVKYFHFDVRPYPEELSAHQELFINFKTSQQMNRFYSLVRRLFFVQGVSKVLRHNTLLVRTYILQSQIPNLYGFISKLADEDHIESYSIIRQNLVESESHAIPDGQYDEETGWRFDVRAYSAKASKLARS